MQKIERKNLKLIYDSISESCKWRKRIQDLILWSDGKTIEIPEDMILDGFKEGNAQQKKLIEAYLKVNNPKSIIEKINSFEDVLKISGKTLKEIVPYQKPINKQQKSQNALAKIQLITEVYNEGVELDWKNSNIYKYSPYFQRKAHGGGWSFCHSDFWVYDASLGFGCYFKSEKLSNDAGKKFIDIYIDYLPE